LFSVIAKLQPDECYHLAAQSFVSYSFDDAFSTFNTNINGTLFVLDALRDTAPDCRFYFAGSSEMFGKVKRTPQNEETPFHPRSPYGISKSAGFDITRNFRESYDMFAVNGILFNHESPRRGYEFVTRKITHTAARIKLGIEKELRLGNLDAKRDWGFAGDYVQAMWLMLQLDEPEDFVIATNETHSVKEFVEAAFGALDLRWADHVAIDELLYRPAEVNLLQGDYANAQKKLGWEPKVRFEELVKMMVQFDLETESALGGQGTQPSPTSRRA
jgi:GDPmannose 4,6-dehydratase